MATSGTSPDSTAAPLPLRLAGWAVLAVTCLGAAYLYVVRGEAMILDLANGIGRMLCL